MNKYLVNYGNKLNRGKDPLYAYERTGDNTVVVVAPPEKLESEKAYFENLEGGWEEHLKQPDAFVSMAEKASYADIQLPDEKEYAVAKKSILDRGGKEVTVTWETSD